MQKKSYFMFTSQNQTEIRNMTVSILAALFWASRDNLRGRFNFSNTVSVSGPKQHFSRTFFENKHGAKFEHEKHL